MKYNKNTAQIVLHLNATNRISMLKILYQYKFVYI